MKKCLYSAIFLTLLASANVATAQIQMSFTVVQPSCHDFTNGSVTVFAVGGSGIYSYAWNVGQTTQTLNGIGAGLYTVTVTDEAQNTASGSITVSQPSPISVAITSADLNCAGTSGSLTATGFGGTPGYTYQWSGAGGNANTPVISVTAPGAYLVVVTDSNACVGNASFEVAGPVSLDLVATDIRCANMPNSGALNTTVSGGVLPYTYNWSNGSHEPNQNGVGAGSYFCTVTSANGCVVVDSDYVDIPTALEVEVIWLTPACGGNNNGSAIVEASGGVAPYVYSWMPGPLSGPSQTGLAPGNYVVSTADENGCVVETTVVIPATNGLDVQLIVTSATCKGINDAGATAVVTPPGSGYVYEWNILPGVNTTQVNGLAVGTFVSVTVTDPVSGCVGTASGTVGEHSPIDIDLDSENILCAGGFGSASATASNGTPQYTYTWLDGIGNTIGFGPNIDGLNPGAYQVIVVDSLGCLADGVVNITILSDPHAIMDGDSVLVCGDSLSTVQFTNLSTDTYNVITGIVWIVNGPSVDTIIQQQNQIVFQLPVDETIKVQLIVTSSLGCSDTTSLVYNVPGYPDFTLSLDSSTLNCVGGPVGIDVIGGDSSYTYVWTPAVTMNPNPMHVLVTPADTATTYTVVVTDGDACSTSASIVIPPSDSLLVLTLSDTLMHTCEDSATLWAGMNVPADIIWTDPNGNVIAGNPITVLATPTPTIYTATATTADTCIFIGHVTVIGYGIEISLDPVVDTTICEGDSLQLGVIANPSNDSLIYHWSVTAPATLSDSTSSNPILTGPAGLYTVTVIVTNVVCADTLQFQVEIKDTINLYTQISADLCNGLIASFFNPSGLAGSWNFGDGSPLSTETNPVHIFGNAGQYQVVFTPTLLDCTEPWDSLVTVYADTLEAAIQHLYVDCALKAIIQYNGSANHSPIISWDWTFSNGDPATASVQNPMIQYIEEGVYVATLTVTDINHCTATATDTVTVDILFDEIVENQSICPGDSIQLNPVGIDTLAEYTWTAVPPDVTLEADEPNPTVNPSEPTIYTVEIKKGLCFVTYTVNLSFKEGGEVHLPADTIVCVGDSIQITAQSNGSVGYEWSNTRNFTNIFATTQTVMVKPNGMYYVRTTDAECTAMDSMMIEMKMPEIQIMPSDTNICLGEETTLLLTNLLPGQTLTYTWNPALPNVQNPIVSPTENTTYSVTVTNEFGCTASVVFPTITVTNVTVDATADPEEISYADPSSTLTATPGGNGIIVSYGWTPAGTLSSPNTAVTVATPTETTTYTVTVTTEDGCIAIDTVTLRFQDSPCVSPFVFVPNAFTPNNDQKNDHFIVKADGMTELKMIIWNRWGEIVYETNDPNDIGWDGTYLGKELTPDSYAWYIILTCGNGEVFESKGNVSLLK